MESQGQAFVRIVEQPAPKALRFRYECEGRSAGSLPGSSSTSEKKTFPKIQIVGYSGRAVVVVSCVTVDSPYRPHPHNLVGKDGCKKGVCTMEIANDDMTCEFSNLGIQCVKKKDIDDSLRVRAEIRVDPFRSGFGHASQPGSIDLNSVRLCFQVFLEGPERGQYKSPLKPVVSDPIYDKKAINDLTIMKLSDSTSPAIGNKEIILLCDKVSKDDIEIRFYEESADGSTVWEAYGDFQPSDVHKQYAISFRTPQYRDLDITSPVRVYIQLRCPSKDTTSIPRPFDFIPLQPDMDLIKRKRQKLSENNQRLSQYFDENGALLKRQRFASFPSQMSQGSHGVQTPQSPLPHQPIPATAIIKQERQSSPDPYAYYNAIGFSGGGLQHGSNPMSPHNVGGAQNNLNASQIQQLGAAHQLHQHHNSSPNHQHHYFGQPGTMGMSPSAQQQHHQQQMNQQAMDQGGSTTGSNTAEDLGNISLPNLSDVNLSLLENHLSENLSTNLILIDPDVQALGMSGAR